MFKLIKSIFCNGNYGSIKEVICPCCGKITSFAKYKEKNIVGTKNTPITYRYYIECICCHSKFETYEERFNEISNYADVLNAIQNNLHDKTLAGVSPQKSCFMHTKNTKISIYVFENSLLYADYHSTFCCHKSLCDELYTLLKKFISIISKHNIPLYIPAEEYHGSLLFPASSITIDWDDDINCDLKTYYAVTDDTQTINNALNELSVDISNLAEIYRIKESN